MTTITYSEIFCCGNCHDSVRIEETMGGDLIYQCSNPACGKVVSVDCPEALALIENVTLKLPIKRVVEVGGDIDFSQDAPTIGAQLRQYGLRKAKGWESGWYVLVTEFGIARKVWATDANEPVAKAPIQFFSYAATKGV